MLVLASAEGVAAITAGATLLAATGLAAMTVHTKRLDLAHNRELADLADLRKLLDEASVALDAARDARDELAVSFTEHGVHLPDGPRLKLENCNRTLVALNARLHVRLAADEAILSHFAAATDVLLNMASELSYFEDDDAMILKEKRETIRTDLGAFTRASLGFSKAAVKRVGTVPT